MLEKALRPHFELTDAIGIGYVKLFRNVGEKYAITFRTERTDNLIVRSRRNVIGIGLCNISSSEVGI